MKSYGSLNEKFVLQGEIVTKEVRLKLRREKNTKKQFRRLEHQIHSQSVDPDIKVTKASGRFWRQWDHRAQKCL
jgi:hypothetical protein